MGTKQPSGDAPWDLHCGICKHAVFLDRWEQTLYCSEHDRTTEPHVGDVCSEFVELSLPGGTHGSGSAVDETLDRAEFDVDDTESRRGATGPFHPASVDGEPYGWFCSNCESLDVAVGPMGRMKCNSCGNLHQSTNWDSAYL